MGSRREAFHAGIKPKEKSNAYRHRNRQDNYIRSDYRRKKPQTIDNVGAAQPKQRR